MNKMLEQFYLEFANNQRQQLVAAGLANHDIYEERLSDITKPNFKKIPKFVYFYYVRINTDGTLKVSHFWYVKGDRSDPTTWQEIPRDKAGLEAITLELALNARRDPPTAPPPCGQINFRDILWRQKSYLIIFFDEKNWRFLKETASNSPIIFLTGKDGVTAVENHTFFDALDLDIDFGLNDTRTAVALINHMKGDEAGTDLGVGIKEEYLFNMLLGAEFATGGDAPLTVIFDPGGTNQGPPIDP